MTNPYEEEPQDGTWVSKMRKQNKELKTEVEALRETVAKLSSQSQAKDLGRAFAARGVDPRMVKYYSGDTSDEAIDKWIEDNDELLHLRKEPTSEDSTVKASDQEAWQLLRELASTRKQAMDIEARLKEADSEADLMKILSEAEQMELPIMPF